MSIYRHGREILIDPFVIEDDRYERFCQEEGPDVVGRIARPEAGGGESVKRQFCLPCFLELQKAGKHNIKRVGGGVNMKVTCWRCKRRRYPDFIETCGYGKGGGIGGWNCRHSFYAFIDGIMEPTYTQKQLDEIDPPPFEYRTYAHIAASCGIAESNIYRGIKWVEDTLIRDGTFSLPGRKAPLKSDMKYEAILVDATESPVERPKKSKGGTIPGRKGSTH